VNKENKLRCQGWGRDLGKKKGGGWELKRNEEIKLMGKRDRSYRDINRKRTGSEERGDGSVQGRRRRK
jgi:hypothetical protein